VSLFVDTSVWSLAIRRDVPQPVPEVDMLGEALRRGSGVSTTGLVLQELLQGVAGPKARQQIIERLSALPYLVPEITDHIEAAELRNRCRRSGVQIETVDALLAQLCIHHDLIMLSTDQDFAHLARHSTLRLWKQ
jgi:predicted nucleic acid-binding protein